MRTTTTCSCRAACIVHDNEYGEGGGAPSGEVGKIISDLSGTPVPDIVWDGVTRIPEWLSWVDDSDKIYIDEAEGTSFINLKMISQLILPWGATPDRDISAYKGSLPEPAPVVLPQDKAS